MTAPLRGTQSLVGQMGWVTARPWLTAIEIAWRWVFGIPFLLMCWMQAQRILVALPLETAGFNEIDPQNPWVAAVQIAHVCASYAPYLTAVLHWLLPAAALAWVVLSGVGRSLVFKRLELLPFRPAAMIVLQAVWLALAALMVWGWWSSIGWVASTHITTAGEPDLVGYSIWLIFLSLAFFTAWALVSWPLLIAPVLMLLEERPVFSSIGESFRLGNAFTGKLVEINLVMGIVKLSLIVLAMVLSAAPLPFSDELGPDALRWIAASAVVFFCAASDYFQVVRLKGFIEFWKMFRGRPVS
jgi:hypothetical protein